MAVKLYNKKMKRLIATIIIIILSSFILWSMKIVKRQDTHIQTSAIPVTEKIPIPSQPDNMDMFVISYNNNRYFVYSTEITTDKKLTLIPNFIGHHYGKELSEQNDCSQAINGGFYQKNGKPLGLFITDDSKFGNEIESNLVNGFFWQEKTNRRGIGQKIPDKQMDFVFQAGPYFPVANYTLNTSSDEYARRSLIGIDNVQRLYLLSIVSADNKYSGPYLADLPVLFSQPEIQKNIPLTNLLNLDGGAASFFRVRDNNSDFLLSEMTPIGSLLCAAR